MKETKDKSEGLPNEDGSTVASKKKKIEESKRKKDHQKSEHFHLFRPFPYNEIDLGDCVRFVEVPCVKMKKAFEAGCFISDLGDSAGSYIMKLSCVVCYVSLNLMETWRRQRMVSGGQKKLFWLSAHQLICPRHCL